MPTRQQITDAIDAQIVLRWPSLAARQEIYRTEHGRYFQGLATHTSPPSDGASVSPERLQAKPTDQSETWQDVGFDVPSPRVAMTIDVYDGAEGQGYTVAFRLKIAGQLWRRRINAGPETWREAAWEVEA